MKNIFINPATGLLRAGWRVLAFFAIFVGTTVPVMMGIRAILGGLRGGSGLQMTIAAITATIAVFVARKYLDKKSMTSLGLKWDRFALLDILLGVFNSALLMAGVYFTMLWTGLIQFDGFTWWMDSDNLSAGFQLAALPIALAVFYKLTLVAWYEELFFRGYILQNFIEGMGLKWTIVVTSLLFGFIHIFNPGATVFTSVLIAMITPQLIYAYLKTGQLWLPIGLHLGWNFFQASVFGFASSGQVSPSLIAQTPIAADWLSGGEFGAEASILIIPFTILSMFLIHFQVRITRQPGQKLLETMV